MKAIVYNIFGLGHINPTLPLIKSLTDMGGQVIYHTSPERKELIETSGAVFQNYGYDEYKASDFNPGANFVLQTIPATVGLLPYLQEEFEKQQPDFIIYDSMAIWGYVLSRIYNIPSFCSVSTFALSKDQRAKILNQNKVVQDLKNRESIDLLKKNFNIELDLTQTLGAYGDNNIVYTARDFNPGIEVADNKIFHFSGALVKSTREREVCNRPIKKIVIAFGTIVFDIDQRPLEVIKLIIDIFFHRLDFELIISVGNLKNIELIGACPEHIKVFNRIDQTRELSDADLFINHGGMNSINEGLYFGVPMLVLPHSHDQFFNAFRIEELNLGLQFSMKSCNREIIKNAVFKILESQIIENNIQLMQSHFQEFSGLPGIISFIKERVKI